MSNTVTISVSEYNELLAANRELETARKALETMRRQFEEEMEKLKTQLAWFQRNLFGNKSERVIENDGTPILPGFMMPDAEEPEPETIHIGAHKRKKRKKKNQECPLEIPDNLETVIIDCDIPEDEKVDPVTGQRAVCIGCDEVIKLGYRQQYIRLIYRHYKYAFPKLPKLGVMEGGAPPCVISGSKFDVTFMAYLAYAKFGLHLPLNRIQEDLANHEIKASRQTLSNLLVTLGTAVKPLWDRMVEKLHEQGVIFTDDTGVRVLKPGTGKSHQAQVFTYVGGGPNAPPYHVYQFTMNRSHKHVMEFLKDFVGFFHADAFEAHVKLDQNNDLIFWAACWSHARRYFENAQSGDRILRAWVLRQIRYLFMYERVAWSRDSLARLAIRQQYERPIVDRLFTTLKAKAPEILPRSGLGKAVNYILRYEKNFRRYLFFPDLQMHNNTSERSMRKLVIGRLNWLFFGSKRGALAACTLLSIIQTCRAMGINVLEYLPDLFTNFDPNDDIDRFLPDRWLESRTAAKAPAELTPVEA